MKIPLTAVILAVATFVTYVQYDAYTKRQELLAEEKLKAEAPASNWFVVRQVAVTDFKQGDKVVPAIYDREIKKPFAGLWFAEIRDAATQDTVCHGEGARFYEPKDVLPTAGVTLDWIMGKQCDLKEGEYYLEINYVIKPPRYPDKTYRAVSPIFKVTGVQ